MEHYIGPDEGEVVENVLEMIRTGDWDQRHRGYPGFHFYIQAVPAALKLALAGVPIAEIPRSDFYLAARRTSLVFGWAASIVTFLIARRFISSWSALLAAALVAFSPLALRESAVVNPDLVLSSFVALSLLQMLRLRDRPTLASFALAGISVGAASAIKYTGVLLVGTLVLAWFSSSFEGGNKREPRPLLIAALAGAATFAALSPFSLIKLPEYLDGIQTHTGYYSAYDSNAGFELARALWFRGMGFVAGVLALIALPLAWVRREDRVWLLLSLISSSSFTRVA